MKKSDKKKLAFIGAGIAIVAMIIVLIITRVTGVSKILAKDLMSNVQAKTVGTADYKEESLKETENFSIELFKKSYIKGRNSLVSPTSIYLALGMVANGADGNTLEEFKGVLGNKNMNLEELNKSYSAFSKNFTTTSSAKVSIANSIWYTDSDKLKIKDDFLQTNANYYKASVYKSDFKATQTLKDMNNWVKNNTYNNIEKIVDEISSASLMFLINTVYFEDKWENIYEKPSVRSDEFYLLDGKIENVDFMHSQEFSYISDDKVDGFMKPYKDKKYSFLALLPKENISLDSYIQALSGESFLSLINNRKDEPVLAALPKFKTQYSIELNKPLKDLGLKEGFDPEKANFNNMGSYSAGNIYIGRVLHKTYISVDTEGTKAAAATVVEMKSGSSPAKKLSIVLNRPFLYAIIDNETKQPLFIGAMEKP